MQFTFKYVFISVALWVAAVIPHSARTSFVLVVFPGTDGLYEDFYYVEKGNWYVGSFQRTRRRSGL
jgi:hypothetical protein